MNRLARGHYATYINVRSSLILTLFSDICNDTVHKSIRIDEMHQACMRNDEMLTRYIDYLANNFLSTCQLKETSNDISLKISSAYPKLSLYLRELKCITRNIQLSMREHEVLNQIRHYSGPYTSIARIGFSYGNNALLFYYLIAFVLGNRVRRLQVFKLPDELSTFPQLPDLVSAEFPTVSASYCLSHSFTPTEVRDCSLLHGNAFLRQDTLSYLSEFTGAGHLRCSGEAMQNNYPDNLSPDLLKQASRLIIKKLQLGDEDLIRSQIGSIPPDFFNRDIVFIGNRDNLYVGSGQEWRNSSIDNYVPAIQYLLAQGFSVVRLNTIAKALSISDPYLIDLAVHCKIDPLIQLHLVSYASLLIGTATGAVGLVQILTSCPTLNIDSACIFAHEPFGQHISSPKRITIPNGSSLHINEAISLFTPLHPQTWSTDECHKYGVELVGLTAQDILEDVIEFLHISMNDTWLNSPKLSWVIDKKLLPYDHLISHSYLRHLALQSRFFTV